MFFFAWSLVISAVHSARRRRLLGILTRCLEESEASSKPVSIVCQQVDLAPMKGLWRCNSESVLSKSGQFSDCVIYNSENREILVVPCEDVLKTDEWRMLIDPSTPRRHSLQQRIWFVAELSPKAKTSAGGSVCVELEDRRQSLAESVSDLQSIESTSEMGDEASANEALTVSSGSLAHLLVNQMCKTVAYNRDNPWKVLYECSYTDFFEIAFHWSEDALSALNNTATVQNLATVRLPENFFTSNTESELLCNPDSQMTSTNSLSVSTPTLSLLELLYWNEFGHTGSGTSAAGRGIDMRTMSVGTLPRYSRSDKSKPLRLSFRYRSCSPLLGTDSTPLVGGVAYFQSASPKALPPILLNEVAFQNLPTATMSVMDSSVPSSVVEPVVLQPKTLPPQMAIPLVDCEEAFTKFSVDSLELAPSNGSQASNISFNNGHSKEHQRHHHRSSNANHVNYVEIVDVRPNLLQIEEEPSPISNISSTGTFDFADYGAYCDQRIRDISPLPPLSRGNSVRRKSVASGNLCSVLIYTGDNPKLFERIFKQMKTIVSMDDYNVDHILSESLRTPQWVSQKTACLLMASTEGLDDVAWRRLQDYFSHCGKIIFICQNNLLSGLSSCHSLKKQTNLLKMAFGKRSGRTLGKDFENFLKKAVKVLNRSDEINETYHARDFVGGYKYSVHLCKEQHQPMFMYMENTAQQASALFSDATTDELMSDGGHKLIRDALCRLGIKTGENNADERGRTGYLICARDRRIVDRLSFTEPIGDNPKLQFRRELQEDIAENGKQNGEDQELKKGKGGDALTIVVCERSGTEHDFDDEKYFSTLKTKSLGKSIISFGKCPSTISVSKSLSKGLRGYDGIVVIALEQDDTEGRNSAVWTSPKGCPTFSFDFNVPVNSNLGRSIEFAQHILTLSVVEALKSLLGADFPAKIKWPNDIFYKRKHKISSIFVNSSVVDKYVVCVLSGAVNVSNKFPTVCLNDVAPEPKLSSEEVIACVMNKFEMLVNLFERKGVEAFLKEFLAHWLHKDEEAYLWRKNSVKREKVVIRGLDHTGHLILQNRKSSEVFCISQQGFTFDLTKKCIRYVA
ncbi:hypothetical protein L596_002095 [Steinernema carpocapsae]|uniref:BPL/LPL catalytic domain-containing protein n=1 Tax=Steinernema carpocapsae TaxID=34508 RepID=A0A4U8UP81_STECR|nr:hypothetical protein L596_002095 [Steinernema carpocapsae]